MKADKQHASRISYGIEIFIVLMSMTGIYFIIGDLDLGSITRRATLVTIDSMIALKNNIITTFINTAGQMRLSDTVGIILIGITLVLSLIRIRDRLVKSREMLEYCPQCGTHMARRHRTIGQRFVAKSLGLTSVSFRCLDCDYDNVIFRYKIQTK